MSLCLAAGAVAATLAIDAFTLAWTHSIEKVRWEEDWRIENGQLIITEARIRGSGAGMEPPPDATLRDGIWHYRPRLPAQDALRLTHSPYAADYLICIADHCRELSGLLPGIAPAAIVEIRPCPR